MQPAIHDRMFAGSNLHDGHMLRSYNKRFYATMQPDGNFVVYQNDALTYPAHNPKAIWNSQTYQKGQGPFRLAL